LSFRFQDQGGVVVWEGTTTTSFAAGTKHSFLFSYSKNVRATLWVDGAEETIVSETVNNNFIKNNDSLILCNNFGATSPFNGRLASFWLSEVDTGAVDASVWGAYFDGSGNPEDAANSAAIWFDWTDYANHGSGSVSLTNHSTTLGDW
jgi:hypothetical protein